ncbi:MAG: hypothetical protein RBT65_16780 [Methanolobus sp.]|jgi:hypothetical protein|nr:hypothetical protein [Methanolobus sp.]
MTKTKLIVPIIIITVLAVILMYISSLDYIKYEHPEGYIQSIDPASFEESSIEIPSIITKYELIIINAAEFKQTADTGSMELNLAGTNFVLEMEPSIWVNEGMNESFQNEDGFDVEREREPIYQYNGIVKNQPESKVRFTMDNQTVRGTIDSNNERYVIEQTGWIIDNNTKRTVYVTYKESDIGYTILESIEKEDEPLRFTIFNNDKYSHNIKIEIFDSSGTLIFSDIYNIYPSDYIMSQKIERNDVNYIYKATLENNVTGTYNFEVQPTAEVSMDINNNSGTLSIDFGYSIA